jgi:hypothetical protein
MSQSVASLYSRYRGFIQGKTRIAMAWLFAIIIGLSARNYPALPGVILCLIGASLRFWASGYLRKDARPAVGGPYSLVRNPLYLGTFLMAVGLIWSLGNNVLLAIVTILFAAVYHFIILDEENKLKTIFGEPYAIYCRCVPRFIPRPFPPKKECLKEINPDAIQHRFSWDLAMKNRAYEAYASFAGLIGFATLCAFFWQR